MGYGSEVWMPTDTRDEEMREFLVKNFPAPFVKGWDEAVKESLYRRSFSSKPKEKIQLPKKPISWSK